MRVRWGDAYETVSTRPASPSSPEQWYLRDPRAAVQGNEGAVAAIRAFFAAPARRCLVVGGACGVGKTTAIVSEAATAGATLLRTDPEECSTAVQAEGFMRRADAEGRVLFIDDAHRFAEEGCGGAWLALSKARASGTLIAPVVLCVDGAELTTPDVVFERLDINDCVVAVQRAIRRCCPGGINYFDAVKVSSESGGDVRNALVRAEFLYASRPWLPVPSRRKVKKTARESCVRASFSCEGSATRIAGAEVIDSIVKGGPLARIAWKRDELGDATDVAAEVFKSWPNHLAAPSDMHAQAEAIAMADVFASHDAGWEEKACMGDDISNMIAAGVLVSIGSRQTERVTCERQYRPKKRKCFAKHLIR